MKRTLVIICQVYPPDPTAVGQHVADVAEEMQAAGWRVVVFAASRDYEDPAIKYPSVAGGGHVEVRRLPCSSFGKRSIAIRLLAQSLFLAQAIVRALMMGRIDALLVSTSPPFAGVAGVIVKMWRRTRLTWWVMDINPDQMVRLGKISGSGFAAKAFNWINRLTIKRSDAIIVLDSYMRETMARKAPLDTRVFVIPPWAPTDFSEPQRTDLNEWRSQHVPAGSRVVMYSGNHGLAAPLEGLLAAAELIKDTRNLFFMFIGGGTRKTEVEQRIGNWRPGLAAALPYQPLDLLPQSLAAADIHIVSVADEAVGINHSCKIYGAVAVGRPVLALAPMKSHVADLIAKYDCGWIVEHHDTKRLIAVLEEIAALPPEALRNKGELGRRALREEYSRRSLIGAVCRVVAGPDAPLREDYSCRSHDS